MPEPAGIESPATEPTESAYRQGRQTGLAIAALAVGVLAFVNLLGLEKALLALTLGVIALRGARAKSRRRRLATAAIVVALVHAALVVTMVALFHDKLFELIRALQQQG